MGRYDQLAAEEASLPPDDPDWAYNDAPGADAEPDWQRRLGRGRLRVVYCGRCHLMHGLTARCPPGARPAGPVVRVTAGQPVFAPADTVRCC